MNAPIEKTQLAAFRKLDADGKLRALRGQRVERAFAIERDGAIDEQARTCWLSIASDQPYERWWGVEILDMSKKSIRDERLRMGAPLLVGHDTADQVGVVESFEITSDKKLRILARFGRSERAEEIWRDVLDGIRRNASVGYVIHDLVLEKQQQDVCTYRVTDWEPLEGSLVPIPADPTVGVGRSAADPEPPAHLLQEKEMNQPEVKAPAEAATKVAPEAITGEQIAAREFERVNAILAAGDAFADLGGPALARELVKDRNASVESFKAQMLEKLRGSTKPVATAAPADTQAYGEAARAHFRHAPLKAFRDLTLADGTRMPAEQAAYRAGQWLAANVYGRASAQKWCRDNGMEVRVMSGNSLTAGGALVPIEMEQAVIDLRDSYGVARRLARVRPMSSDQMQIPRRSSGLTGYFFNDDDGTGITASDKGWSSVTLSAKKLGVLSRVSRDLIDDAVINVVDDLAQEMGYAFAVKEDGCFINGDGTSTYGGMLGLRPAFVNTAYSSRITLASGVDTFAEVTTTDLASVMAGVAAYGKPGAVWLVSQAGKATIFDRLKAAGGGNDVSSLGMSTGDMYLGYPIVTSEAMPNDMTADYTSLVMFMFGRFDLAASFGSRRGIEVQVLQERYAELGQIGIVATERFDSVIHDLGSTTAKGPVAAGYGQ